VRSHLSDGRIARLFFTVRRTELVLLHGFIKKSQKTPSDELSLAQVRKKLWWQGVE
jgi:phage-related protein